MEKTSCCQGRPDPGLIENTGRACPAPQERAFTRVYKKIKYNSLQTCGMGGSSRMRPRRRGDGLARRFAEEEQAEPHHVENPPAFAACGEGKPPAGPRGSWQPPGPAVNPNTTASPEQTCKTIRVSPANTPAKGYRKKDKISMSSSILSARGTRTLRGAFSQATDIDFKPTSYKDCCQSSLIPPRLGTV